MRRLNRRLAAVLTASLCFGLAACSSETPDAGGPVASVSDSGPASKYKGALEYNAPLARPSFTLTDTTGAKVDFKALTKGKPTLLYFGYTHCPDVCPTILGTISAALTEVPPDLAKEMQVVFVTTDPARDTPEVLAKYLAKFDGQAPNKYVGLTGTLAEVEAAQTAAGVPVAEDNGQQHSTLVVYYGRSDIARVAFLAGVSVADMIHDLPLGAA